MYFKYLSHIFLLHCILFVETQFPINNNLSCFSNEIINKFSDIIRDLFYNFSKSTDADILRNQFIKENIPISCLSEQSNTSVNDINNGSINHLLSTITKSVFIPYCLKDNNKLFVNENGKSYFATYKVWIYGLISVTIINACAALGVFFIPLRKKKYYKVVMSFMIALAVGSLTGSALLILIPDAMQLTELQESSSTHQISYKFKATVVFGGVYMFFLVERFLKWIIGRRVNRYSRNKAFSQGSINLSRTYKPKLDSEDLICEQHSTIPSESKTILNNNNNKNNNHCNNEMNIEESRKEKENHLTMSVIRKDDKKKVISPVAWMIICGDALHNFIDGLSIGASFSRNIMTGVSLSIAVLCEELPHELGDFAILLNAGMSVRQALMWNMLSAATCYVGFIIGVILGETTTGSTWIFAIAGGMFLYISLVDMMPEMNAVLEDNQCSEIVEFGILKTFVIQNIGLLFGYTILLMMALYGDRIKLS